MPGNFYTVTIPEIAAWPYPVNYINPPDERTWLPGFAIFWCVLASVFVIARLYLRIRGLAGTFGYDDFFLIVAWVFAIAFTGIACISVWDYNIGRHVWEVLPDNYEPALYYAWIAQVLFCHSTGAIKTSILLFYRRMTKSTYNPIWGYTCYVLLFITVTSWVAIFLAYCLMCFPLNAYWKIHVFEQTDLSFTCLDGDALTIASGVITIASDFWSAVFPIAMFYSHSHELGISKRQRTALNIIFCLGLSVTGVGIARTYYLWKIGHDEDLSWIGYDLFVTSQVECQLAIICTCAPSLRVLFRRYLPDRSTFNRSNNTSNSNTQNNRSWRASIWTVRGSTFQPTRPLSQAPEELVMSQGRGDKWQKIEALEQHDYSH